MQIPKNIKITNATGKTVAFLSPKADGLKDVYVDCRLNGESTLEFLLPATSEKIVELTPECEIWANDRVYILRKDEAMDTVRDENNKLWTKVIAVEKWYELDTSYVEPSISNDPTARPPADLAVIIVGGGSNLSGNRYSTGTAAHALYAILQGSGWTMGTVDVTGIRDLEAEKTSRLGLIKMIQEIWSGYLLFDSANKIIHLRDSNKWQPYTGFQVRYKKNLKHITRTQSNKIVTKLYPFGHDDLDIANVNGGKKYITNNSYTPREYVGIYKNQDIYSQEELLEKAIAELELICRPRYLYKVKLVDVRVLPEYEHENFTLGDMADIIDPDIAPDSPRPRIIRHKYNLFRPWECELDIGDPEERLIEQLKASFNTTGFIGGKFNGNGQMSGNYLEDLTVTDAKIKNLTADKITAGTIDAKKINVINLNANNITAGYISADLIEANSIGADKIKTRELVVGDNIQMGSNAVISWKQVDGKPFIPDDNYITTITEDTIKTTNVIAKYLTVKAANIDGVLTADQVTTKISQVNSYLRLGETWESSSYIEFTGQASIEVYNDVMRIGAFNGIALTSKASTNYEFIFRDIVDFSNATVIGLEVEGNGDEIRAYYPSNRCYIDYSPSLSRLIIRDKNGISVGYIPITS